MVILLKTIRYLKELGGAVRFECKNTDTLTSDCEFLLTLLASFDQAESQDIGDSTHWGIRSNFQKGIGNHLTLMIGYRCNGDKFVIVSDEAETVGLTFRSYLSGMSPDAIATMLQKGTKTVKKAGFSYWAVYTFIRQEKYLGISILQKTFTENSLTHRLKKNKGDIQKYLVEGTHPAIISAQDF